MIKATKKEYGYHIEFTTNIPSKKNSKQMVCRGKRPMLLPSKSYSKWVDSCNASIEALQKLKNARLSNINVIEVDLYDKLNKGGTEPKRTFDLSNKFESIADYLVDIGFLEDDNYKILSQVILKFGGYRPEQGADAYIYIEKES